jgi:hypothetical protein
MACTPQARAGPVRAIIAISSNPHGKAGDETMIQRRGPRRARAWLMPAVVLLCAPLASCFSPPRVELINAESPATGPAGASGSGGTGAAGSSGSGGTMGGTTQEGARETAGGPAGKTLPREAPPELVPLGLMDAGRADAARR